MGIIEVTGRINLLSQINTVLAQVLSDIRGNARHKFKIILPICTFKSVPPIFYRCILLLKTLYSYPLVSKRAKTSLQTTINPLLHIN